MLSPHASARLYEAISHLTEHAGGSITLPIYGPQTLTLPAHRHSTCGRYSNIDHDEVQNTILNSILSYLTVIIHVCLILHFG